MPISKSSGINQVYFNGEYMPMSQVSISPLDRGFLFGDSIYEAIPVYSGKPLAMELHLERLLQGLELVGIETFQDKTEWEAIIQPLLDSKEAAQLIYMQVSRGVDHTRRHRFPLSLEQPTILIFAIPFQPMMNVTYEGCQAHLQTDLRWQCCNIKSASLMGNVMAYRQLWLDGVANDEALLVRGDYVVEAPSSNLFIVQAGQVITPRLNNILEGVTRNLVLQLARELNIPCVERLISQQELLSADEVWVTNSMEELKPIVKIDNHTIGNGKTGAIWKQLLEAYQTLKR